MRHNLPPSTAILRDIIKSWNTEATVSTVIPKDVDGGFILVTRVGGGPRNTAVDEARFTIHVYAPTSVEAEETALSLAQHLDAGSWKTQRFNGFRAKSFVIESIFPLTDPSRATLHRYQITGRFQMSRLTINL